LCVRICPEFMQPWLFAFVALLHVISLCLQGEPVADTRAPPRRLRADTSAPLIHVALCSDDKDLRPAAVAIRSAAVSAADPDRLVFHFVTTPDFADQARLLFADHVPGLRIEVHHSATLDAHLADMISWRRSSKSRRVLSSVFNFAPFYLAEYLSDAAAGKRFKADRIIYLDTDTLILGDLGELSDMDLRGHPCAAVQYCLQRFEDYISFEVLETLGFGGVYDPKSCIANRGLFVIDVPIWKQKNITGKIEGWMQRYRQAEKDLWFGGMSQPPWLLAMNGDYLELGDEWNCNSLGRDRMSMWESVALRKSGFDHKALRDLGAKFGSYGSIQPYIVTCSANAKMLHYNGEMKPWVADRLKRQSPFCAKPRSFPHEWSQPITVRVFCDTVTFITCSELWGTFITPRAIEALRDLESEWAEEELRWADQKIEDRQKADKERHKKPDEREGEWESAEKAKAESDNSKKTKPKSKPKKAPK